MKEASTSSKFAWITTLLLIVSITLPVNAAPGNLSTTVQTILEDSPDVETEILIQNNQVMSVSPVIDIWNESWLRFGHLGNPQTQVNILGNVSDPDGSITALTYRLNGGNSISISIGPNGTRLENPGDFNIAINTSSLIDGMNRVVLTAEDNNGDDQTRTIDFPYTRGQSWDFPYATFWAGTNNIYEQGQIVDGYWYLSGGGVRPVQVGYDRLIAIGETSWSEYEILVPITTHGFYPNPSNPTDAGGVGVIARWTGHTGSGTLPSNWWDMGAYAYYSNRLDALALRTNSTEGLTQNFNFQLGQTYMFKLRAETEGSQGIYSFKIWQRGQSEPDWSSPAFSNIVNVPDPTDARLNGSILLVAHRVDATFGDVTVCPLNSTSYPLSINISGGGDVIKNPSKSNYRCGEYVSLTAVAEEGWTFTGWSGERNSSNHTITFDMPPGLNLTATFSLSQPGQLDYQTYVPLVARK